MGSKHDGCGWRWERGSFGRRARRTTDPQYYGREGGAWAAETRPHPERLSLEEHTIDQSYSRPLVADHDRARGRGVRAVALDAQRVDFIVYERGTLRPIGTTYLYEIDERHSRAGFGIIIGEENARGNGYGTEATRLTLDYAFTALGLNNVMLTVYEFNLAGIHAYRNAGFQEIGRRRRCSRLGPKLWDLIYMDCIADEFESPVLKAVFQPDEFLVQRPASYGSSPRS